MGQIFCALVLFFVLFSVDAWSIRNSEHDETLCSEDHPFNPLIKLFDDLPEEWSLENDDLPKKKAVCFTRTITTEFDANGKKLNKFSSYEITFDIPKKYKKLLKPKVYEGNNGQEFINYPPLNETSIIDDITTKKVIYVRCSKTNEETNSTPEMEYSRKSDPTSYPEGTTVNHDLDFINDLDELCDEHLDIDILNTLPSGEATVEPDFENTRRHDDIQMDFESDTSNKPEATTTESIDTTETLTIRPEAKEPSILARMDGGKSSEITTEIATLIAKILKDMNNSTETTLPYENKQDFTVSIRTLEDDEISSEQQTHKPKTTTQPVVTEKIKLFTEEYRNSKEPDTFIIQLKNMMLPNSRPECYLINSNIKYGKCLRPNIPIRILTESTLPETVNLDLSNNLEYSREFGDFIVSGKKQCYLLKKVSNTECPINPVGMATVLEIDDLPDHPNDHSFFTIEFEGQCTTVSKNVDVIECPLYQDTLPHLKTEHLPDHVRFKHTPGEIDVHVDDIIVHSFSHCLLLKTMKDIRCRNKPDIILKEEEYPDDHTIDEFSTIEAIGDDDSFPTYRLGDYSLERISGLYPRSFEIDEDSTENKSPLTTPCGSEEDDKLNTDQINRTTRTLSHLTTPAPEGNRRLEDECDEDDLSCIMDKIKQESDEIKTRRTINPFSDTNNTVNTESTTPVPRATTFEPTKDITEITIPNSKKLSKLLKTIIDESKDEPRTRASDIFKPDFIIKIACAEQITKYSCYYVSKYIMQPSFDDPNDYKKVIDKSLLPVDAKIVPAPNLNIFAANETIYAISEKDKYVFIKKQAVDCPEEPKDSFYVLDTGSCAAERRDEQLPEIKTMDPSMVKYQKGNRVYCFDFDDDLRLHLVRCPEDLSNIPVLSHPEDLKTLCRSQLKKKGPYEQMKLLRRLNIVSDYS